MEIFNRITEKIQLMKTRFEIARAKHLEKKEELVLKKEEKSHLINLKNKDKKTLHQVTKSRAIVSKFDKKAVTKKRRFSKFLEDFLEKAGVDAKQKDITNNVLKASIALTIVLLFSFIIYGALHFLTPLAYIIFIPLIILFGFAIIFILIWLSLLAYFDFKIYQRTGQIEDVLPDFLQLTSANISAGMPIDRALWFAVRPRFGVLAKEMEEIAKATFTGSELDEALLAFTQKYRSRLLKESVNLIIAGIRSGGELGDLLNKISENILQTKIMRQEISASVMTYVIFIGVASVLAAPLLFALSAQLLNVVTGLAGNFDSSALEDLPSGVTPISFNFGSEGVNQGDFKIFSITLIIITSFFAAAIIGVIQKGDAKSSLAKFPMFLLVSFVIFYFSNLFLGKLLGGLMG